MGEFYKEHPKLCAPDDYWGQVKRTIDGVPVGQEQIDLIVRSIVGGLDLRKTDSLLDLCCGNGALSRLLFEKCAGGLGVDFSEYLISIARKDFERPGREEYLLQDVVEFVQSWKGDHDYAKCVCYGSFMYLSVLEAEQLLQGLRKNFCSVERFFIGNMPDRQKKNLFIAERGRGGDVEDDPQSFLGLWWERAEFEAVANRSGWQVSFGTMPEEFFAHHYRFDAILRPT